MEVRSGMLEVVEEKREKRMERMEVVKEDAVIYVALGTCLDRNAIQELLMHATDGRQTWR